MLFFPEITKSGTDRLKWHFCPSVSEDQIQQFEGKNEMVPCKSKIQLKNFVLKGNFKLSFSFKFPEGMVMPDAVKYLLCGRFSYHCSCEKHSIKKGARGRTAVPGRAQAHACCLPSPAGAGQTLRKHSTRARLLKSHSLVVSRHFHRH